MDYEEDQINYERPSHLINDETFDDKLRYESYFKAKKDIKYDSVEKKQKHSKFRFFIAIILMGAIGGFSIGIGQRVADYYIFDNNPEVSVKYVTDFTDEQSNEVSNEEALMTVTHIAELLEPSVVAITNEIEQQSFFGIQTGTSSGSGVIFDMTTEYVYILTNNHVIEDSTKLQVSFFGDDIYDAEIIGADENSDLAVLKVKNEAINQATYDQLRKVTLGNSDELEVGEMAVAIGNPLGYNNTVTSGIISALDRFISDDLNSLSLIQTDAAINPGNSGGALVNGKGQLIGINTIKISDTSVEGIGFAIPINSALPILEEIMEKGYVSSPFIGIYGVDITKEKAEMYKVPIGVLVSDTIPGSPANKYGMKAYDIIVRIETYEIDGMEALNDAIMNYNVGDTIEIEVMRDEGAGVFESHIIQLKIGDRHDY